MSKSILYAIFGLLAGFCIGFAIANAVYRKEITPKSDTAAQPRPQPKDSSSQNANASSADPSETLSEDEVQNAIAAGDKKPDDIQLQRKLGLGLYGYAGYTQDARYLPDAARFLKRAFDATPNDREVAVTLGNVLFVIAQESDAARFPEARTYYEKALELKADDAGVRTNLGRTYYLSKPSDPQRAIAEYRKALAIDARHEATLQSLAVALIVTGNHAEAQKHIDELQRVNPSNASLSDLRAQLAQSKNAQQ